MGLILITAVLLLSLAGCLSPVSLDAYGYVISIGVDSGVEKKYYYTFALQRELSEQNTSGEGGAITLACEADSIFEAVGEIEGNIPYSLNFSRTGFIVMGREPAEAGALRELVTTSFDTLKIRTSAVVIVAENEAYEFIGGLFANNDANITKLQTALMLDKEKTGMDTLMSVSRLIEACSEGRFDYSSALGGYDGELITDMEQKKAESEGGDPLEDAQKGDRVGGLKSFVNGAALFSGWRMTGALTREETLWLNVSLGELRTAVVDLVYTGGGEAEGTAISVGISPGGLKRTACFTPDGAFRVIVDVTLKAGVRQKDERISSEEADAWLKGSFRSYCEERLKAVFLICRGASSDAMRFGTEASKLMKTPAEWEAFAWKDRYPAFEPEFIVTVLNVEKYIEEDMQ